MRRVMFFNYLILTLLEKCALLVSLFLIALPVYSQIKPSSNAEDINYYTEIYPPANFIRDGELMGMSIETLKLMWHHMQVEEQPIQVVPWARGYRFTETQANSVLFTMARSEGREEVFKWVGPIFTAKHVIIARAEFEHNISTIEDAYPYTIAAIRNDISEISLIEEGFPKVNIAPLSDLKQSMLMLQSGRIELIIVSYSGIKKMLAEHHLSMDDFQIVLTVNEIGNYFAFNKHTPDALINQFQQALDASRVEHRKLLDKYQLSL